MSEKHVHCGDPNAATRTTHPAKSGGMSDLKQGCRNGLELELGNLELGHNSTNSRQFQISPNSELELGNLELPRIATIPHQFHGSRRGPFHSNSKRIAIANSNSWQFHCRWNLILPTSSMTAARPPEPHFSYYDRRQAARTSFFLV